MRLTASRFKKIGHVTIESHPLTTHTIDDGACPETGCTVYSLIHVNRIGDMIAVMRGLMVKAGETIIFLITV